MGAVFLSEEWVAELAAQGAELPAEADASMVIQHEIAGAQRYGSRSMSRWM